MTSSSPVRAGLPDAGSPDLASFYRVAYPRLVAVLLALSGSRADAEDVAQEAFARLVPRWERVQRYDEPEAWLRQVGVRLLTSRWRRTRTAAACLVRLGPPPDALPPGTDALELDALLAGLSRAHRLVLVLHHGLGLPVEEVARELGLPVGTVKSRLSRARAAAQQGGARWSS